MKMLVYIRTVLWSLIGIGTGAGNREAVGQVKPLGLLTVAAVLVAVFLLTIYGLVHLAVGTLT